MGLHSSKEARKKITLLQVSIKAVRLDKVLLQCFRECLRCLNLSAKSAAELLRGYLTKFQLSCTVSRKPGCSGQKFSNLIFFDFGILVPTIILQGI